MQENEVLTKREFDLAVANLSTVLTGITKSIEEIKTKIDKLETHNGVMAERVTRVEEKYVSQSERIDILDEKIESCFSKIRTQRENCAADTVKLVDAKNNQQILKAIYWIVGSVGGTGVIMTALLKLWIIK